MSKKLLFILFLGLLTRLILVPLPGYEADIAFWKSWSLAATDKGIVWLVKNTNYNYPAGFALILWSVGKIYHLLVGSYNFQEYWQAGNYLFLLLAKMPSILADLVIAAIIYYFVSQPKILGFPAKSAKWAGFLSGLYLFHPVVLFDGAWWGQVDSFGIMFAFLTLFFLAKKNPVLASVSLTAGFLLKMQNIIFLPLFFLFLLRNFSWKKMVQCLTASFGTFLIMNFPFLKANDLGQTINLVFQNFDWFPYLSLNAYNLWWLVSLTSGQVSDKILILGITNAKTVGLMLFSFSYLLATGLILFKKDLTFPLKGLVEALTFVSLAFFVLPTQSHERYIFSFLALSLLVLPYFLETKNWRILSLAIFIFFSVSILINLNNSLVSNYPENGISFLKIFQDYPDFRVLPKKSLSLSPSVIISLFNLFTLGVFVLFVAKNLPFFWNFLAVCLFFGGIIFNNLAYLLKKEICLTQLKPISVAQDFGSLQINQNLASAAGPKSWAFLSVNYYFYPKGFATHANSKIVFDLGKKFEKFATDYGIDSDAGANGSVIFEIWGDGKQLFSSKIIKKFDLPQRIEVNVKGVKTLELIAKDAGDGIIDDHADWLEPVLYR